MQRGKLIFAGAVALLAIFGVVAIITAARLTAPPGLTSTDFSSALREAVTTEGIMEHQRRFQQLADANGGNRAAGTPGYDASADYVAETLREAGYDVTIQEFALPPDRTPVSAELRQVNPVSENYLAGEDFAVMQNSGGGEVTAEIQPVDITFPPDAGPNTPTSGCEAADFEGFVEGRIALLRRGTCTFGQKAENAVAAGAGAVLIFNNGRQDRTGVFRGTLEDTDTEIPVLGLSSGAGRELLEAANSGASTVRISIDHTSGRNTTSNVIAETPGGDPEQTVVAGAHLDSVPEGPGINDNGSGSATILEIAQEMAALDRQPANKVRFIFWGGEELGLLGSEHYVDRLSEDQINNISVYLNFDMVASPNYAPFLYGSREVTQVFENYFDSRNLQTAHFDMGGRSDHGPFADEGIPVGGIFTGDSTVKTEEQAETYGGEAGEAYDRCYHRACDDLDNLSRRALDHISDAAAHAISVYAQRE